MRRYLTDDEVTYDEHTGWPPRPDADVVTYRSWDDAPAPTDQRDSDVWQTTYRPSRSDRWRLTLRGLRDLLTP